MNIPEKVVCVRISPHEQSQLKVTWTHAEADLARPYAIDRDRLNRSAAKVRQCLSDLVNQFRTRDSQRTGACLKALAVAGWELRYQIFDDVGDGGGASPTRIQTWMNRQTMPYRIHFRLDDRIHVPFGLMYDSDPAGLSDAPENADITTFPDFWALKFFLSALYGRIDRPTDEGPRPRSAFDLLPIFNESVLNRTKAALGNGELMDLEAVFLSRHPAYSKTQMLARWLELQEKSTLLCFLCHANGTALDLGNEDSIHMDDLRRGLKRRLDGKGEVSSVIFLNGCSTATGHKEGGFLEALSSGGLLGFVGTETNVPDVFALRFSIAFARELLAGGASILSIMNDLRRRHWPLGLLYSIYCYPHFTVQSDDVSPVGAFYENSPNFCELAIGSNDI